jgi:hypothetical protein
VKFGSSQGLGSILPAAGADSLDAARVDGARFQAEPNTLHAGSVYMRVVEFPTSSGTFGWGATSADDLDERAHDWLFNLADAINLERSQLGLEPGWEPDPLWSSPGALLLPYLKVGGRHWYRPSEKIAVFYMPLELDPLVFDVVYTWDLDAALRDTEVATFGFTGRTVPAPAGFSAAPESSVAKPQDKFDPILGIPIPDAFGDAALAFGSGVQSFGQLSLGLGVAGLAALILLPLLATKTIA